MSLPLETFALGARLRKGIRLDEVAWLIPFILAGMALGLTLLIRVAEEPLLLGLGAFVLLYAAYGLTRRGVPIVLSRLWSVPVGLFGVSGLLTQEGLIVCSLPLVPARGSA